jgi:hypothetical protein
MAVRIDRLQEFLMSEEATSLTRWSNSSRERLVRIRYASLDKSRGSSKLNRCFPLYRIRNVCKSTSTSLVFKSWCRMDNGLTKLSASFLNPSRVRWSSQHRAPSGIHTFLVKSTKHRSSDETTFIFPSGSRRHTQQVLKWHCNTVLKN